MSKRNLLSLALGLALFGTAAGAAELVPINFDGANEGYNDNTAATPVGGNPGTTIGQQRWIVAQFAANSWGAVLQSNVPVYVGAQFNPLAPNVLGSAGATNVFSDFPHAGVPATWYSGALADAISGTDLDPGFIDINSQFSSTFTFYYGLDGNTPAGQVNFLDVVMHEFGHGLGFQNFENEATGAWLANQQDIYSTFTYDNSTSKRWTQMTQGERATSGINTGNVIFDGPRAVAGAALILGPRTGFRIKTPPAIAGDYPNGTAAFGPAATTANFNGAVVVAVDAVAPVNDGCSAPTNAAAIAGKIAFVDRGVCGFAVKTKLMQDAGAIGVIIGNNAVGSTPPGMAGVDATIVIPTISVTQTVGTGIKANAGVTVGFVVDNTKLQGADNAGRPRLYMPNPVEGGSSGSHYDTALSPNALMEPAINSSLRSALNIDITPNLLKDTGWTLNEGDAKIDGCDTNIDVVNDAGIIVGANVQATSQVCAINATQASYRNCMSAYTTRLSNAGLINNRQAVKLNFCAAQKKF